MSRGFSVVSCAKLHKWFGETGRWGYQLGGLLALGPGDGLDRAERSVEPGLLGSLHLVEGQTQMVLQVLNKEENTVTMTYHRVSLGQHQRRCPLH